LLLGMGSGVSRIRNDFTDVAPFKFSIHHV
jgi:hypothetical protein